MNIWNIFVSKKYMSQNMKNCKYTSKVKLWVEFCNKFFSGEWYWCTSTLNCFKVYTVWLKIHSKCVFLHLLSNKCIINSCFWEKNHYLKKKEKILQGGHCIVFSFFFVLVLCHEPQMWGPMAIEKMYVI